jgi:hypothetical protein
MADLDPHSSPAGRRIVIVRQGRPKPPAWVARRRRAYKVIDLIAAKAKMAVRRWLVPRPRTA